MWKASPDIQQLHSPLSSEHCRRLTTGHVSCGRPTSVRVCGVRVPVVFNMNHAILPALWQGRTRGETMWRLIEHRLSRPGLGYEMDGDVQSGIPRRYPWGGSNGDNGTIRLRHICCIGKSIPPTLRRHRLIAHAVPVSCSWCRAYLSGVGVIGKGRGVLRGVCRYYRKSILR